MATTFVALDVETANPDLASICQIGAVTFVGGEAQATWQSLVNPEDEFDPVNVAIHGIDEAAVQGAPRFPDVAAPLAHLLAGHVIATHTAFDRVALARVHDKYALGAADCRWLDTARVCRRAWGQFARQGYGLASVAAYCGIQFRQHDALEDARAAGLVLLRAISDTGLDVEGWLVRTEEPIDPLAARPTRAGNPDGELFGEVVVFTGALSMPRHEAADLAALAGCEVAASVGHKTTLLVVGDQDIRLLAGHDKSSKHRKAEELISKGQPIRVLTERDFRALLSLAPLGSA